MMRQSVFLIQTYRGRMIGMTKRTVNGRLPQLLIHNVTLVAESGLQQGSLTRCTKASGVLFDNIVITADPAQAKSFADQSWKVRHDIEVLQSPDLPQSSWFNTANMAMAVTGVAIL